MSYTLADVLDGLETAYKSVSGMGPVLSYEPKAFQGFPTMFTVPGPAEWLQMGMGGAKRFPVYELTSTLVFLWQDNEPATAEFVEFLDSVPAAVHADMTLGGVLDGGANCIVESCDEPTFIEWANVSSTSSASTAKYLALIFHLRAGPMVDVKRG